MIHSFRKRIIIGGLVFLLTIITLSILRYLFPYTGLAAIIAFPFIYIINGILIFTTILLSKNFNPKKFIVTWGISTVVTVFVSMVLFPQEFRPNVFKQISNSISAIYDYESCPYSDIDILFSSNKDNSNNNNTQERYIVALFKYRKRIPLDGSFHIYREDKLNIIGKENSAIHNIHEIQNKLGTGQDNLIWWVLERIYN